MNSDSENGGPNPSANEATGAAASVAGTETAAIKSKSRDWKSWLILIGGLGAILWGFFGAIGSGWGLWGWESGFAGLGYSMILALVTLIFAGVIFWLNRRKGQHGNRPLHWIGVILALVYLGYMGITVIQAGNHPMIHDISTDLADPPAFSVLPLREDNWDDIPGEDDDEMAGLNPQQRWRSVHQESYGDIRAVRIDKTVKMVMEKAERLAEERDWDIAAFRVAEGRMEATDTSSLFRFKDDVVLRVRPTEDGKGSIVDMRSVSRVGISDVGVNAVRVKDFLADLSGTVPAE